MHGLTEQAARRLAVMVLGFLTALPIPLLAADAYLGIGVGATHLSAQDVCAVGGSCSLDKNSFGGKLYGGYQFTDYFAVEGAWTDLGKASGTERDVIVPGDQRSIDWRARGLEASVLFGLPVGDVFRFYNRLGAFRSTTDVDSTYTVSGSSTPGSVSRSETNFVFGLGGQWVIAERFDLRVEWQRFLDVGDSSTTGSADVDFVSLGLMFYF